MWFCLPAFMPFYVYMLSYIYDIVSEFTLTHTAIMQRQNN